MQYRRAKIPGASYFFTLVTAQRQKLFADLENVNLLREAFRHVRQKRPFVVDAAVILPDHLHCIWTLPQHDADFPTRWRLIKTYFTKHCDKKYRLFPNRARLKKQQQAVWQHRYWEHCLKDDADFTNHVDYIHYNPVKHRYVERPVDWVHSSIHVYIRRGILSEHWGAADIVFPEGVGCE